MIQFICNNLPIPNLPSLNCNHVASNCMYNIQINNLTFNQQLLFCFSTQHRWSGRWLVRRNTTSKHRQLFSQFKRFNHNTNDPFITTNCGLRIQTGIYINSHTHQTTFPTQQQNTKRTRSHLSNHFFFALFFPEYIDTLQMELSIYDTFNINKIFPNLSIRY